MSLKSFTSAQEVSPHTPASWRERTPEERLAYLSALLSQSRFRQSPKHQNREDSDSLLREALHNARACIPYLREQRVAVSQGELVTSYHPDEVVVVNGGADALARAVVPLVAGCVVRIVGSDDKVPEELKELLFPSDDGLDSGHDEESVGSDSVDMGERVALLIDFSADMSSIKALFDPGKGLTSGTDLYVHKGLFESVEKVSRTVTVRETSGISITRFTVLDDAIEIVNKLCYDIACIYGDTSSIGKVVDDLTVPQVALNISPTRMNLTTDGASILQYVRPQRVILPFRSHLALLRQYMVGHFDNSEQIAQEKASGGQRTAYAIHINDVIDDRIEGGPQEGVFHILEETYKYAPGERNPQIAPLILRFEEINGAIVLSSMKAPHYVDKTALRNDNPCLWFGKGELRVSPSFPERQIYRFDESEMEFILDVEVRISETERFRLSEILARDRLVVSEKRWVDEKLKAGFYEDPFIYNRVYS